jgi:hypothetical protein
LRKNKTKKKMSEKYINVTRHTGSALDIKPKMKHETVSKDVNLSLDKSKGEVLITQQRQKAKEYLEKNWGETYEQDDQEFNRAEIIKENAKLKEEKTCRVCRDNDANKALLPCGHLCVCAECAGLLTKCPRCEHVIRAMAAVYFG